MSGTTGAGYAIVVEGVSGLVIGNTATGNNTGIYLSFASDGYRENVLVNTGADAINVNGGTSMGNNLCNGVVC